MRDIKNMMGAVLDDLKSLNLVVESVYTKLFELQQKKLEGAMDDRDIQDYKDLKEIIQMIQGRIL